MQLFFDNKVNATFGSKMFHIEMETTDLYLIQ